MNDYFKNDEYWKEHINKKLEIDMWIDDYKNYFENSGKCLELGCGVGQYSKRLMEYGYEVTSTDISEIAIEKVKEFNNDTKIVDMSEKLPFEDESFDLVISHTFLTAAFCFEQAIMEMKRVAKVGSLIGTVNIFDFKMV